MKVLQKKQKAVKKIIDGCSYFGCPLCDFIAKSGGKVDGHLVTEHGYNKLIANFRPLILHQCITTKDYIAEV